MSYAALTALGFVLTTIVASANRCLYDIAWHEFEELCRRRKKPELFGQILELREQLEFGLSTFQTTLITATACWMICWFLGDASVSVVPASAIFGHLSLIVVIMLCGAIWIPRAIAKIAAEYLIYYTWRWWWMCSVLLWPLLLVGKMVGTLFQRASGTEEHNENEEDAFEEEILSILSEAEKDGVVEAERADMIEGVMDLDDHRVTKVMTPRSRIDALDVSSSWEKMVSFAADSGRTRIPVYDAKIDNILGILYVKDLLKESLKGERKRRSLRKLLRKPLSTTSKTQLDEMLKTFLAGRMHMAVVKDEYGGLAGVVTIEDILEEIVGEIEDETDDSKPQPFKKLGDSEAEVRGDFPIDELNEKFGLTLPEDEEYTTVGGLLMSVSNRIPSVGHKVELENVTLIILEANRRSIRRVKVIKQ